MSDGGPLMLSGPDQMRVFGLLQLRGRLHLEMTTGMTFSRRGPSTLQAVRHMGLADTRDRWVALCAVNAAVRDAGGPYDRRSLGIQKQLAQAGKRHEMPLA